MTKRTCELCGREHRGIGAAYVGGSKFYCSLKCRDTHRKVEGKMTDWSELELRNIEASGRVAGEYLESIGKFDLHKLSPDEWRTFLQCYTKAYHENYQDTGFLIDDNIPF